jgi:hypothetical protein
MSRQTVLVRLFGQLKWRGAQKLPASQQWGAMLLDEMLLRRRDTASNPCAPPDRVAAGEQAPTIIGKQHSDWVQSVPD